MSIFRRRYLDPVTVAEQLAQQVARKRRELEIKQMDAWIDAQYRAFREQEAATAPCRIERYQNELTALDAELERY